MGQLLKRQDGSLNTPKHAPEMVLPAELPARQSSRFMSIPLLKCVIFLSRASVAMNIGQPVDIDTLGSGCYQSIKYGGIWQTRSALC
jgi:hypothetical protein